MSEKYGNTPGLPDENIIDAALVSAGLSNLSSGRHASTESGGSYSGISAEDVTRILGLLKLSEPRLDIRQERRGVDSVVTMSVVGGDANLDYGPAHNALRDARDALAVAAGAPLPRLGGGSGYVTVIGMNRYRFNTAGGRKRLARDTAVAMHGFACGLPIWQVVARRTIVELIRGSTWIVRDPQRQAKYEGTLTQRRPADSHYGPRLVSENVIPIGRDAKALVESERSLGRQRAQRAMLERSEMVAQRVRGNLNRSVLDTSGLTAESRQAAEEHARDWIAVANAVGKCLHSIDCGRKFGPRWVENWRSDYTDTMLAAISDPAREDDAIAEVLSGLGGAQSRFAVSLHKTQP